MLDVYTRIISRNVSAFAEALEPFDEHEEWALSCQHYSLTLARTDDAFIASIADASQALGWVAHVLDGNTSARASESGEAAGDAPPAAAAGDSACAAEGEEGCLAVERTVTQPVEAAAAAGLFGHSAASVFLLFSLLFLAVSAVSWGVCSGPAAHFGVCVCVSARVRACVFGRYANPAAHPREARFG
jgi:hypothetical protein